MSDMLWGGRFSAAPADEMLLLTSSIATDIRLLEQDVAATKAHARVLVDAGLLERADLDAVDDGCDSIVAEWNAGTLAPEPTDEDVHSFVERILTERLGETGARIHAGRSRNDLVATDLRLWCRARARELASSVGEVVEAIVERAAEHAETAMPGYTHLQRAQPITLGFHLAAHGFAFVRDGKRFLAAAESADVSPLGAGALAGTTLPLDAGIGGGELRFSRVFDNAMDAVSDRDFIADLLYAAALCGVHLSRLAEEVVLWTSAEFGFARLPDEWSTGSSMMPQKRNPDLAELVRGRSAGGIADLTGLLTLLKSLPLAYDRDLQEDKAFLFASVDRIAGCLLGLRRLVENIEFDVAAMKDAASSPELQATDAAERLVSEGIAFRDAHHQVGAELASQSDAPVPSPKEAIESRASHGGTAPERVREQVASLHSAAKQLSADSDSLTS